MKHLTHIILLSVVLSLFGCSDRRATSVLNHADSLLSTCPDTVLVILDSLRAERSSDMSRRQKMRLELMRADAQNKSYVNFTTDSVMREVTAYYDAHGTAQERMRAHYLLGCTYRDMGDAPRALECYHDAIDKADTTSADCDYKLLSRVYGQMAVLFQDAYLPYNQIEQLKNSCHYALKAKDTLGAICSYDYMGSAYYLLDNYDSCIIINEKSSYLFAKHGYKIQSARSLGLLSSVYVDKNDLNNAKRCIETYEREGGVFDQYGNIEKGREIFYYNKGMYLLSCNKLDSAEYYFRKTLSSGVDKNNRVAGCNGLIELYRKLGNNDSIAKYSNMCQSLYASINKDIMSQTLPKMQSMYDYSRYKYLAEKKEQETLYLKMLIGIYILFFAATICVTFLYLRAKREKRKIAQAELLFKLSKLQHTKDDLEILLSDSNKKFEKLISSKNTQIEILEKELGLHKIELSTLDERIKKTEISQKFSHLLKSLNEPSKQDWDALEAMFNDKLPFFSQFIYSKFPKLSNEDLHLCMLIRLGYRPLEISVLMGISQGNITNKRRRLLNKIYNRDGKPGDFDAEIYKISHI